MELEMRGLYLGQSNAPPPSTSTDNGSDLLCYSDVSDEHPRSEKSLGQHIQAMARDHVQQDRSPCNSKMHSLEKTQDGIQLEKYMNGDDPRNLSTKELHLRMVQSGLISVSPPQSAVLEQKTCDISRFKSMYRSTDINPDAHQLKIEPQGRNLKSHPPYPDNLITDPLPSEFWKEHQDFFQDGTKSTCIDQISFPKEHDVDSLEGDTSCSNSAVNSQRRSRDFASSSLLMNSLSQEDGNSVSWRKQDLAPVRFQQWVTDAQKSCGNASNGSTVTSPFFCNVRSTQPLGDIKSQALDCTVEEVSTDSEYSKIYDSSSFKDKAEKHPSLPECNKTPIVSNGEPYSALKGETGTPCSKAQEINKSEHDSKDGSGLGDVDVKSNCDHSAVLDSSKLIEGLTNGSQNCVDMAPKHNANFEDKCLKFEDNCMKTTSYSFKEDPALDRKPIKSNSGKISIPKNDCKKEQNHQVQLATKRKNETKMVSLIENPTLITMFTIVSYFKISPPPPRP